MSLAVCQEPALGSGFVPDDVSDLDTSNPFPVVRVEKCEEAKAELDEAKMTESARYHASKKELE